MYNELLKNPYYFLLRILPKEDMMKLYESCPIKYWAALVIYRIVPIRLSGSIRVINLTL